MRIPVVIGYVTCDYSFKGFGGRVTNKGPSVLLLRRGFNVSAMTGLWSVVAGVDDIVDERFEHGERQKYRAFDETVDETGIGPEMITTLATFARRDQSNPEKPNQVFEQTLFWAQAQPVERVALSYEHMGAVWVSIHVIEEYLRDGVTADKELSVIIEDGVVPGFWEGMKAFCSEASWQRSKP